MCFYIFSKFMIVSFFFEYVFLSFLPEPVLTNYSRSILTIACFFYINTYFKYNTSF